MFNIKRKHVLSFVSSLDLQWEKYISCFLPIWNERCEQINGVLTISVKGAKVV